jgi:hypothetical protein
MSNTLSTPYQCPQGWDEVSRSHEFTAFALGPFTVRCVHGQSQWEVRRACPCGCSMRVCTRPGLEAAVQAAEEELRKRCK